ncbi:MAG: YggS family pyridoxal phosphate-dependent enzyme [Actinobacteria bacterium]|nr:YggS family pyridoxal phosphate-dependent enzyme [Actinomycetota bacterium]
MKQLKKKLADNLSRVREKIATACGRVNRDPTEVTLVAVTKSVGLEVIRTLAELGQVDLGENRPQELLRKTTMLEELNLRAKQAGLADRDSAEKFSAVRWHMIGHLQRNKVSMVLNCSRMIHSVDSLRLAEEISIQAGKRGISADVLMEVNCSGESSKYGIIPAAVNHLAEQFATLKHIRLMGLMTMGPLAENPEDSRKAFVRLRELFEEMHASGYVGKDCKHLSMGTTQDYMVAAEEGATMVRVGRDLFEGL